MTKTTLRTPIRRDRENRPSETAPSSSRSGYGRERRPRELNVRLLLGTIVAAPALAAALYFWHDAQMKRLATSLITHADQAAAQDDWQVAADAYHRAWKIQQDPEILAKLAPAYDKAYPGSQQRVLAFYQRALGTADASRNDLRVRLAELLYREQQFGQSVVQCDKILAKQPNHSEAIKWRALATLGQHRNGEAVGLDNVQQGLTQAIAEHPKDLKLALQCAQFLRQSQPDGAGDPVAADQLMQRLVNASPDDPQAWMARYHYRRSYGVPGAERDLDIAVGLAPNDPDVLLAAARDTFRAAKRTRNQSDYLVARELFRRLIDLQPQRVDGYLGLGDVLYSSGDRDQHWDAITIWKEGQKQAGENASLLVRIAEATIQLGNFDQASQELDALDAYLASPQYRTDPYRRWAINSLSYLRGLWHLEQNQPHQAIRYLEEAGQSIRGSADQRNTAYNATLALGKIWSRVRRPEQAAIVFDDLLKSHPDSPAALLGGAQAWANLGDEQTALRYLAQLPLAAQRLPDARLLKLQCSLQEQQRKATTQRDWSAAEAVLREARQQLPESWQLPIMESRIRAAQGQVSVALSILTTTSARYPRDPDFALQLPAVYEQLGLQQEANRAWERLRELRGDVPQVALTALRLTILRENWVEAARISSRIAPDQLNPVQQIALAELRHTLQSQLDPRGVDLQLLKYSDAWKQETWPLITLLDRRFDGTSITKDPPTRELLQELLHRTGETHAIWLYFSIQSLLTAEQPDAQAIRERIGLLRGKLPLWDRTLQAVAAWEAFQAGVSDDGVAQLPSKRLPSATSPSIATVTDDDDGDLRSQAVRCWQVGNLERARELLLRVTSGETSQSSDILLLADCDRQLGDWQSAANQLAKLTAEQLSPRGWAAKCEAQMHLAQYDQAEATLDHWQDHTGLTPSLIQLRSQLRQRRGWQEDPRPRVEEFAREYLVPSTRTELPRKILRIAEIYFELGDADSAEQWLQMLDLSDPLTFAELSWLRHRFDPESAIHQCLTAWEAHREPESAVILAQLLWRSTADTPSIQQCYSTVAAALAQYPQHRPLAFAASQLCRCGRTPPTLIDQLKHTLREQPLHAGAWSQMAILELDLNQLEAADQSSSQALSSSIWPSGSILTTRGRVLLARGKTERAIELLSQARRLNGSPTTLYALAAARSAANQRDAARAELEQAHRLLPIEIWNDSYREAASQLKFQLADE